MATPKDLADKLNGTKDTTNTTEVSDAKDTSPEDQQWVLHRESYITPEGVQDFKDHRVKLEEWDDYAKEHGF